MSAVGTTIYLLLLLSPLPVITIYNTVASFLAYYTMLSLLCVAPFHPLEAALRLVHAFSEQGGQLAMGDAFPALVRSLQRTDVAEHPHPRVTAAFFEVSLRNLAYLDPAAVARLLQALLGARGVGGAGDGMGAAARDRAAYCVLKVVEGTHWQAVPFGADVLASLSGRHADGW